MKMRQPKMPKPPRSKNGGNGKSLGQPGGVNQLTAAPMAVGRTRVNPPKARNATSASGARTIVFEEYVQDIISSATTLAFSAQSFPVQPGISALFAWLADQAVNYQEYRFRKLAFKFETDQTVAAGKIMYAFSPDAADPTPLNKQEMLEYGVKGKSAIWQEFIMPVPVTEALGARRYIRSGTLASNLDIKTYDLGELFVATSGVVATSANVGELYIQYEVELLTPIVQSAPAALAKSLNLNATTGVTAAAPFGSAPVPTGGLDITFTTTHSTWNRVGKYLVTYYVVGTGLFTGFVPTLTTNGFCTATNLNGISNAAANAGTAASGSFLMTVSGRGGTCSFTISASATTVTNTVWRVSVYSGD